MSSQMQVNYVPQGYYVRNEMQGHFVRAQVLENLVIKDLKEASDYKALSDFFQDTWAILGIITLGSLLYRDKHVTLILGATTTLSFLANSFFHAKYESKAEYANTLNREVEELKRRSRSPKQEKSEESPKQEKSEELVKKD